MQYEQLITQSSDSVTPGFTVGDMTSSWASLRDLLISSGAGDQEAFARFYDATASRVYGWALDVLGDPTAAETVTADVFVAAWRSAPRFATSPATTGEWIAGIAWATIRARHGDLRRIPDESVSMSH
jgi:DNA-directed RNA polymerase specialized sigma24 family protein